MLRRLLLLLALTGLALPAAASPWTLAKGKFAGRLSSDVQWGNKEWLIDGTPLQRFPLQGRYFSGNIRLGIRYGITDRVEIGVETALSHVEFSAGEIFLGEPVNTPVESWTGYDDAADNIISLDRSATGLSDIFLYGRFRVTPPDVWYAVFTPELRVKVPTGYAAPEGTFVDDDPVAGVVSDDVTLGDGQLDVDFLAHGGFVPVNPWFLRVSGGFRLRLFGPGQQVLGSFKTGVKLFNLLLPYAEIAVTHTINDGKVVGITQATADPDIPASRFRATDLKPLEYRLDRSHLNPSLGLILALEKWEIDVGYSTAVWGRNVAQLHVINVGVSFRP